MHLSLKIICLVYLATYPIQTNKYNILVNWLATKKFLLTYGENYFFVKKMNKTLVFGYMVFCVLLTIFTNY